VNLSTVNLLIDINRQFYQSFGTQFSSTRQRLQPGVVKVLQTIPSEANILDLGCGNGELSLALFQRGHLGTYTGLDFSTDLLDEAKQKTDKEISETTSSKEKLSEQYTFLQVDLHSDDWDTNFPPASFDVIFAFAVLHHLPGDELRRKVLHIIRRLLTQDGRFIHSEWQFLNSERLKARIQPWQEIGLSENDVDPGDYLLDWRHGGYSLRYVHHFSEDELFHMAHENMFSITKTFHSDGEGGQLGLYQVWAAVDK
jgi:SAM-dependent methyltransferase